MSSKEVTLNFITPLTTPQTKKAHSIKTVSLDLLWCIVVEAWSELCPRSSYSTAYEILGCDPLGHFQDKRKYRRLCVAWNIALFLYSNFSGARIPFQVLVFSSSAQDGSAVRQ